jgi:hypothetical protein
MNLFRDKLNIDQILQLRTSQYVQSLYVENTVPAGKEVVTPLPLSTIGSFLVLYFTGFFTSLMIKLAGTPNTLQDLGICPLRMKIQAGASTLQMFGDYVPMNLLLSPGRQRVNPGDAMITGGDTLAANDQGPIPNQLFYPMSYQFPFAANDTITIAVKNDYDAASGGYTNRWGINFIGIRARDLPKALKDNGKKPSFAR